MWKMSVRWTASNENLEDQNRSGITLIKIKLRETGCEDGRII
jgi:hypothetical protein